MKTIKTSVSLIMLFMVAALAARAQDAVAIQKRLISQYALTQPTADNTDIVTAGSILVLQKDKLTMVATTSKIQYESTYKDGKINPKGWQKIKIPSVFNPLKSQGDAPTRTFVKNEKMWVTGINVKGANVVFDLFTDAYNDVRFKASLNFPVSAGATPDDMLKLVGEVFTVQPSGDDSPNPAPANAPAAAPPGAAPAQPEAQSVVPPPPPPPDAPQAPPKAITLGQTPDQVVAILGQPQKTAKIGKKETYFYPDMKVIFVDGKVNDVQ